MGAEVVVFSTSADKEKEAKGFGATEFIVLNELEKLSAPVNVLIIAGSKYPDWDKYVYSLPFPPLLPYNILTNLLDS